MHLESQHHNRIIALQDAKDKEAADKTRKLNDRLRALESEKNNLEDVSSLDSSKTQSHDDIQEFDSYKARMANEKRHWSEQLEAAEARIRKEEEGRRKDLDIQVHQLLKQRDSLSAELNTRVRVHTQALKDHEQLVGRLTEQKTNLAEQLADLKAKESHHAANVSELNQKLIDVRKEGQKLSSDLAGALSDLKRANEELVREKQESKASLDRLQTLASSKDLLINRLKEELKRREEELEEVDEAHFLKVFINFIKKSNIAK
jgi:chromosome segregation ATPase